MGGKKVPRTSRRCWVDAYAASVAAALAPASIPGNEIRKAFEAAHITVVPRPLRADELPQTRANWFASAMRADCGKSVGFETRADAFRVSRITTCKTFADGMEVVGVDGVPLFGDADAALTVIGRSCARNQQRSLMLKDGRTVAVACTSGYVPPLNMLDVSADAFVGQEADRVQQ